MRTSGWGCLLHWFQREPEKKADASPTHLRWVRKLPLTCPDPSHPGVGQLIPSLLPDFQTYWEPLT